MRISRIYSEPEIFKPVDFEKGINFISGERAEDESLSGKKTNGVGKTLLLSLIDFCLLSDYKKSKVSEVPESFLPSYANIILDLTVADKSISITRNIKNYDLVEIHNNGNKSEFDDIESAKRYLNTIIFNKQSESSFRANLKPFKRMERKGFDSIINPDGVNDDPIPFLNLIGIETSVYSELVAKAKSMIKVHGVISEVNSDMKKLNFSPKELPAIRNDLKSRKDRIDKSIEALTFEVAYESITDDIARLDDEIKRVSLSLASFKEEIRSFKSLPEHQEIPEEDIKSVYEDCVKTLGNLIAKELNEIIGFKLAINDFKNELLGRRKAYLNQEISRLSRELKDLSAEYQNKAGFLNQAGSLKSLKGVLAEQQDASHQYQRVSYLYDALHENKRKLEALKLEKANLLHILNDERDSAEAVVASFQETILEIHEYLYGNHLASFDVKIISGARFDQKTFVKFDMEIDDKGSSRTEQEKILIFDFALMFNEFINKRHLRLLIHDGAFEGVNEDTKFQILNWLFKKESSLHQDFQYIATINRDSFELEEERNSFDFNLDDKVKAYYDKNNRLFRGHF